MTRGQLAAGHFTLSMALWDLHRDSPRALAGLMTHLKEETRAAEMAIREKERILRRDGKA